MSFDLDSIGYNYLIQILNERYYQTTDIKELKKIKLCGSDLLPE